MKAAGRDRADARVERMFAEWQFGDPMSSTDAWRPETVNRSHRTRPKSEGGQGAGLTLGLIDLEVDDQRQVVRSGSRQRR